jgi:hypothetical protein
MLPDGFHFEQYTGGPGLYLGEHVIATATPANYDSNPPWRICINPAGLPRYEFRDTEEQAVRYVSAWANKWEVRIREAVGQVGDPFTHLMVSRGQTISTTHPRKRRSRR